MLRVSGAFLVGMEPIGLPATTAQQLHMSSGSVLMHGNKYGVEGGGGGGGVG